ncbi:MAG: hypothetical protein M3O02_13660 [Acidobacteriota bacterium]|nr:hypothetical protein [Acidobacteriota bacterium]
MPNRSRRPNPSPPERVLPASTRDPEIRPANRQEIAPVALAATILGFISLYLCFTKGFLLLYGDAVAHLAIARRILDSRNPGLSQLGGVWLPLPHLLMLPFVRNMAWWQSGLAGAWPSLVCYIAGAAGFYKLARRILAPRWAVAATAFYGLNPNLLYLATTAMTEPLFLALLLWIAVVTAEAVAAIREGRRRPVIRRLAILGILIFAAVFTRYDGWILGAAAWCIVAFHLWRARPFARTVLPAFLLFTAVTLAGPLLWLWYNQHFFHDPLDFMRGPYSAPAIEKKTSPPGSRHYRGWHNPAWALLFYTRTAQVDAAFWETGFALLAAALTGALLALRRRIEPAAVLLLWMPLAFYVYSIAYGSVPIFIPQLYPHSFYNARYGLELLPALALYAVFALAVLERRLTATPGQRLAARILQPAAIALAALNSIGMMDRTPSILKEALVNSSTRIPFEESIARILHDLPPGVPILMQNSDHVGALQDAGIPLRQTVNEGEYYTWRAALQNPAGHAAYIVAIAGDPVAQAVADHPENLDELTIVCTTGQPCARIYRSTLWGKTELPDTSR